MDARSLSPLETLLRSIDGELALSAAGQGERRTYQVWFWKNDQDNIASGRTLHEALDAALAQLREEENRRRATRRPG